MYILFLDESGTPPSSAEAARKREQRYFVIGGVVIPAAEWKAVSDKLQGVKTRFDVRGEIKWRFFAPGNVDKENPMREMRYEDRDRIRIEVLKIITSVKSVRVMASVASIPAAFAIPSMTGADDIYRLAYKTTTERFQYYLQDLKSQTGSEQYGLVVSDHRSPDNDRALRAAHQRLTKLPGVYSSRYMNLIETVFFAPSHMSVGIQLADMVAGAVWRKFERGDSRCYDLIEPAIRRSPSGNVDGFGLVRTPRRGWV